MLIPRDDARLHVQRFGQGPLTLLAIGGWTAPGLVWHECFTHLPNWRCASLDHRGTGLTEAPAGSITLQAMADDVLAVVDALGPGPCVLAAESMGCAIALQAALRAPTHLAERLAGLVLCGAAWKPLPAERFEATSRPLRANHDAFVRGFVAACLPEARDPALLRWGHRLLRAAALDDAVALMRWRVGLEWPAELRKLALPTLVLHGSDDRIVTLAEARELAAQLPRATLAELPGLGHAPMVTAPQELAWRIERHFCALDLCTA